jgi:hypothetical protein
VGDDMIRLGADIVCFGSVHTLFSVGIIVWSGSVGLLAQRGDTEGIKETNAFLRAGGDTVQAVAEAKLQVLNTMSAYNALVTQPSKDMKSDYRKLLKHEKDMNDRLETARARAAAMGQVGTTYFAGRTATIKAIQSEERRTQAASRILDNQLAYSDVLVSLREAAVSLEPVQKDLDDQIENLGSDLSPGGTSSLAAQAAALNERGSAAIGKVDLAITRANSYFGAMRATQP